MKRKRDGGFWLCLLMNLLFDLEWSIPAWLLLILRFVLGWPIWLFVGALAAFFVGVLLKTAFLSWAASVGNIPDAHKENLNPYSLSTKKMLQKREGDNENKS